MNKEVVIETINRELIMTVTADLARREGTTPEKLAKSTMDILKEKLIMLLQILPMDMA
jgi:hypothetical protein